MTMAYPQKGPMILQRTSPPWLETPFEVFDKGVFTPNDQHYVSWHWATFRVRSMSATFRLTVRGHVNQTLSLSLDDLLHGMPRGGTGGGQPVRGNSRIYMQPRVPGASRVAMLARVSVFATGSSSRRRMPASPPSPGTGWRRPCSTRRST